MFKLSCLFCIGGSWILFYFTNTLNWICTDTNFCIRPVDHVDVEQCNSCPWGWMIIQGLHIQNALFFKFSNFCVLVDFWILQENLAQGGWLPSSTVSWRFTMQYVVQVMIPQRMHHSLKFFPVSLGNWRNFTFSISGDTATSYPVLWESSSLFGRVKSFCPSLLAARLTISCRYTWELPTSAFELEQLQFPTAGLTLFPVVFIPPVGLNILKFPWAGTVRLDLPKIPWVWPGWMLSLVVRSTSITMFPSVKSR